MNIQNNVKHEPKYNGGFSICVADEDELGLNYAIITNTSRILRESGATRDTICEYGIAATRDNFRNIVAVTKQWVNVELH
jgi:hypothetical protein